jgi:uncharacterized membrane protein YraQ (UPF0718 family)
MQNYFLVPFFCKNCKNSNWSGNKTYGLEQQFKNYRLHYGPTVWLFTNHIRNNCILSNEWEVFAQRNNDLPLEFEPMRIAIIRLLVWRINHSTMALLKLVLTTNEVEQIRKLIKYLIMAPLVRGKFSIFVFCRLFISYLFSGLKKIDSFIKAVLLYIIQSVCLTSQITLSWDS